VSDPRTDPGVRVRGPEVGSLTPRLLSCAGHPRGNKRRAIVYRYWHDSWRQAKRAARETVTGGSRRSARTDAFSSANRWACL